MLTDPTYLRYIVDGLHNQYIQQENLAALPQGLIGIYEEALPWEQNLQERGRFLQFFSAWALLKKEVSAILVSSLLNWPEQEVIDALATHTKWFNSPASGTYILYHERLRTYLLSKITSNQLKQTNQKIIKSCQHALELKKGDEWEIYALEHLPSHLLIPAMQDKEQGASFRKLVYDTSYWNRQLEISKGYDWSKKMLNLAMVWAAKQNTDELIECALNKIDLHYMEQNDAPRIVELVAQNDIETALQRIESFGGNDKEGLQRKFTLYMLCLMELTLLESKAKPYGKIAIEKLLNHLDENIPVDHSLLIWNNFFPSYLMFQMACEWAEMGLDYLRVYKRTDEWKYQWIEVKGPYSDFQFKILLECESLKENLQLKKAVISEMVKQGKLEESFKIINHTTSEYQKNENLQFVSIELAKRGMIEEAIAIAQDISKIELKDLPISIISIEFAKQGKIEKALSISQSISENELKANSISTIAMELAKQRKFENAIFLLRQILNGPDKYNALLTISNELFKIGEKEEGLKQFKSAISCIRGMNNVIEVVEKFIIISKELFIHEMINEAELILEEALKHARDTIDELDRCRMMYSISNELARQGNLDYAESIYYEVIQYAIGIDDEWKKSQVLFVITTELAKYGKFKEALEFAYGISVERQKDKALVYVSTELAKKGKIGDAIKCAKSIYNDLDKYYALIEILINLVKKGDKVFLPSILHEISLCSSSRTNYQPSGTKLNNLFDELENHQDCYSTLNLMKKILCNSLSLGRIGSRFENSYTLKDIALNLLKVEKYNQALKCNSLIKNKEVKFKSMLEISTELSKKGRIGEAEAIMLEASLFIRNFQNIAKFKALSDISSELAKQGKINESIEYANRMSLNESNHYEDQIYIAISTQLARKGNLIEALKYSNRINRKRDQSIALSLISTELVKQGKIEESEKIIRDAIICARSLDNQLQISYVLILISTELLKQQKNDYAESILNEGLLINKGIKKQTTDRFQPNYIDPFGERIIPLELVKQGKLNLAEKFINEMHITHHRNSSWYSVAHLHNNMYGPRETFQSIKELKSVEAKDQFLKYWSMTMPIIDINDDFLFNSLYILLNDPVSLEYYLNAYGINYIFFSNTSLKNLYHLNKTLNLQWAIDIKESFEAE